MKIFLIVLDLPGHVIPGLAFKKLLEKRGHEVVFSKLSMPDMSPAPPAIWLKRCFEFTEPAIDFIYRSRYQDFDALITDPSIFAGANFALALPWAIFGNLPIFIPVGNFVAYLQATIPSFEPNFTDRKRFKFLGPLPVDDSAYGNLYSVNLGSVYIGEGTLNDGTGYLAMISSQACSELGLSFCCKPVAFSQTFPYIDLFITNGGYGGVQTAIRNAIPMIVAGDTEDKATIALQVETAGIGIDLKTSKPSLDQMKKAISKIKNDFSYRKIAKLLQSEARDIDPNRAIKFFEKQVLSFKRAARQDEKNELINLNLGDMQVNKTDVSEGPSSVRSISE